ncbi:maleylacetoacetate isomerase (plasmid) [Gemmobacter fulvus]|uniref:Maleylacetoacetate isomerase n=1 Tax=Gemmobacter fulvus TaxID=2840474 RepID=A0A975PC30_9RHOB|nr:maleylacetoacetate isomerase [Gemmobacter fulvus]MBT9246248.1 maleylacetoacetate isomerase [Gemmobacter fulvus]QWK92396.1 maleylacetoacetate isomerase [Gemmobacter fulvus]
MILHDYWRSSAGYRLRIALNLLGLDYQRHAVDLLAGEQRSADHLARNPQGLVPALEIDGRMLTQSLAILEYLDETRAAGFLPQEPGARARVRALSYAIAMDIHPVCNLRVARHAVGLGGAVTMEGWMQHFIRLGLDGVEGLLAQGGTGLFCHGDQIGMADICLVPQVYNARRWGVDLAAFPQVAAIAARAEALPAFAAAHPDRVQPAG